MSYKNTKRLTKGSILTNPIDFFKDPLRIIDPLNPENLNLGLKILDP